MVQYYMMTTSSIWVISILSFLLLVCIIVILYLWWKIRKRNLNPEVIRRLNIENSEIDKRISDLNSANATIDSIKGNIREARDFIARMSKEI